MNNQLKKMNLSTAENQIININDDSMWFGRALNEVRWCLLEVFSVKM